jgi:sulfatase maturation enzyme AslB (radical SAM superfamily)
MTPLPVVPRMAAKAVGIETWMRAQNRGRSHGESVAACPSDFLSSPPVQLKDCRGEVELFYYADYSICNYHCPYCYVGWAPDGRKNWDTHELFPRLVYRLSRLRHRLKLNMENLGEWFTSKELIDATLFLLRRENVTSVSITTNASLLPRMSAFLDQADVNKVAFTCTYHATEVALGDFLQAVTALRDQGANVVVATVCFPDNLQHCVELKRQANALGVHFRLNLEEKLWREATDVSQAQRLALYDLLEEHRKWDAQRRHRLLGLSETMGEPCTAGQSYLWLNSYGDIFVCSSALLLGKGMVNGRDEACLGNIFELEEDYLPSRTSDLQCPFAVCSCPKDVLRQKAHQQMFRISDRTRHEVYFRSEEERTALLARPPVTTLR